MTLLLWMLFLVLVEVSTQEENEEFYLGFVPDFGAPVTLLLLTNDAEPVHYSVEAPVTGYHHNGSITRNGSLLTLPSSLTGISRSFPNAQNNAYKEGVYIKTNSKKVTIICESELSSPHDSSSTYSALPTENLGIEEYVYYAVSVEAYVRADASVVIVGTADGTNFALTVPVNSYIKISNNAQWTQLTPGTVYSYQINRLQIMYIAAFTTDLTGTKIVANKPISVFSGHECAWIPDYVTACDNIVEQMLPTELWGKVHYIAPLSSRESYTIKILAEESSTSIQLHCSTVSEQKSYVLNAGSHITEKLTNEDFCVIFSTKKILVVQFSHGKSEDGQGDPMMVLIPPTTHYTNTIITSTMQHPNINGYSHYLNVIVIAEYFQTDEIFMTTGGVNRSLGSYSWTPIMRNSGIEAYVTQVNVLEGVIEIFHVNKSALMTAIVYGFAAEEGYGHAGWLRGYRAVGRTGCHHSEFCGDASITIQASSATDCCEQGGGSFNDGTGCVTACVLIEGDPHFSIPLLSDNILCYSIQGYSGLSFNLIFNKDFVINALFVDTEGDTSEATWIGKLAVVPQNHNKSNIIVFDSVNQEILVVDDGDLKAATIKQITFTENGTVKFTQTMNKQEGHPTIHVIYTKPRAKFDVTFYKNHLNVDWSMDYDELHDSHGLMGQFMKKGISIDTVKQMLVYSGGRDPVPVTRDSVMTGKLCWKAENYGHQGEGLIEGDILDYVVSSILDAPDNLKKFIKQ